MTASSQEKTKSVLAKGLNQKKKPGTEKATCMRLHPRGRGQGQGRAFLPRKDGDRSDEQDLEAVPLGPGPLAATASPVQAPPGVGLGPGLGAATRRRPPFFVSMCALLFTAVGILSIVNFVSPSSNSPKTAYSAPEEQFENFITVQNGRFMDGSKPFFVAGINVDTIVEGAIKAVYSRPITSSMPYNSRDMIKSLFKSAATSKLNVIRTWAHTTDASHPLQQRPKVYSEDVFEALDYVLAEAGAAGLRVILSFVDTWRYRGGVAEIVDWSPTAPPRDPAYPPLIIEGDVTPESMTKEREEYESSRRARFFTDPGSKELYKAHMAAILNRRNTYTKKRYVDDPTIFAFDLINEPRCDLTVVPRCPNLVQDWIEEMAAYFRSLDKKHLLTVGEEGFWGQGAKTRTPFNPGASGGSSWASETGQDFVRNHATEGISFASIHAWTDNWNATDLAFMEHWLEEHAKDAAQLGKPLLLEEFGKKLNNLPATDQEILQVKDPVFKSVYSSIERSLANGGPLQGSLAWEMAFRIYEESPQSPYGISIGDSTFEVMKAHAQRAWMHSIRLARDLAGDSGEEEQDCWVARPSLFGSWWRSCMSEPEACDVSSIRNATFTDAAAVKNVFESKKACCRPGTGAFEHGCSSGFLF